MAGDGLGRILIVDDEPSVREVVSEYFSEQGYGVETAGGGEEALALVQKSPPDLVLLDVRMQGLDGVETLRRLRALAPQVSVIMVTANEDVGLARETLKLGALDYVAKPFDFVYLERAVLAGMAQAGSQAATAPGDPWRELVHAVFRTVRGMGTIPRASTGARLEEAALASAREAAARRREAADGALGDIELLLSVAAELRDLAGPDLTVIQGAVEQARRALRAG
ncbi:MAG TPA: response regulator [Methylomirabilota bacterium]|nr:response regulator [Methylomirabilota bacterium]